MQSTKLASVVTLLGLLLLLVIQPGIAQEEPPYMLYLPLIVQPTFTRVTLTQPANWGLYSRGADLAAATLATDIEVRSNDVTCFAWNSGNAPPYSPQYTLTRSFIAFDLSTAPEGTIVQAQLELYPGASFSSSSASMSQSCQTNFRTYAPFSGSLDQSPAPPLSV